MKKVIWLASALGLSMTTSAYAQGTITISSASKSMKVVVPGQPNLAPATDVQSTQFVQPAQSAQKVQSQTLSDAELNDAIDDLMANSSTSRFSTITKTEHSFVNTSYTQPSTYSQSNQSQPFAYSTYNSSSIVSALDGGSAPSVAARYASRSAHGRSSGRCALYVRKALQSAGYQFTPLPSAYQYAHGTLAGAGFTKINSNNYVPQVGDVVVFNRTAKNPHGHIQIYDGSQWVSDFRQNKFSPYAQHNGYTVWRDSRYLNATGGNGTYLAMNEQ